MITWKRLSRLSKPTARVALILAFAYSAVQSPAQTPGADRLTPSELEEMLGPVALYPDPLLANVLAACVYPDEVAEAAAFIAGGGKPEQVDAKPWEDPVKAVAKIPDAIKMMGQYKDWTIAMGQAYLTQAKDVMDVIQTLRKKAQEAGALQTSPQQQVVTEQQVIYIKPADPQVIYVPTYSPAVVYAPPPPNNSNAVAAGVIGFGVGVATGLILANNLDCDWHGGCVGYGNHGDVNVNVNNNVNVNRGGNTVNTGNVNVGNTNVSGNNVANTSKSGNRVGNEGNAYAPNKSKQLATAQPNQTNQFKGGATAANRAAIPGGSAAALSPPIDRERPNPARGRARPNREPNLRVDPPQAAPNPARGQVPPNRRPNRRIGPVAKPEPAPGQANPPRNRPPGPALRPVQPHELRQDATQAGGGKRIQRRPRDTGRQPARRRKPSKGKWRRCRPFQRPARSSGGGGGGRGR